MALLVHAVIYPADLVDAAREKQTDGAPPIELLFPDELHWTESSSRDPENRVEDWILNEAGYRQPAAWRYLKYLRTMHRRFAEIYGHLRAERLEALEDEEEESYSHNVLIPASAYLYYLFSYQLKGRVLMVGGGGGVLCGMSLVCEYFDTQMTYLYDASDVEYRREDVDWDLEAYGRPERVKVVTLSSGEFELAAVGGLVLWLDRRSLQRNADFYSSALSNMAPEGVVFVDGLSAHHCNAEGKIVEVEGSPLSGLAQALESTHYRGSPAGPAELGVLVPGCPPESRLLYNERKLRILLDHDYQRIVS